MSEDTDAEVTPEPREHTRPHRRSSDLALLEKWGPRVIGGAFFLVTTTASAMGTYYAVKSTITDLESKVHVLEKQVASTASDVARYDTRMADVARQVADTKQDRVDDAKDRGELLKRTGNIEKYLARLVCTKNRGPDCDGAMALLNPQ